MTSGNNNRTRNVWMVHEYNPKPDHYIAITLEDESTLNSKMQENSTTYCQLDDALKRAYLIQEKYDLKQTRIFSPNKASIIVNNKKRYFK
jgi:hypothetical protein